MKKQVLGPVLAATILAVTAIVPAYGQSSGWIRAHIPFTFTAGSIVLPAGDYSVSAQQGVYRIRNSDNQTPVLGFLAGPGLGSPGTATLPHLRFHRYGEHYFLAEISMSGSDCSTLPKSNKERETALGKTDSVAKNTLKTESVDVAAR